MATLRAFRAVRPRPELAAEVACVPYDVVDADEARTLARDRPRSFLRVLRPEIDLPPDSDPASSEVYRRAGAAYRSLLADGVLIRDEEPSLFVYRIAVEGRTQTGVVGCCSVDDYESDVVKKHERTRPDKELDRTRHALAIGAHVGPVFLTHRPDPLVDELAEEVASTAEAVADVRGEDGSRHTVWRVPEPAPIEAAFAGIDALYVADGHHRSACAARVREVLRRREVEEHDADVFLAVSFPSDQLRILPYNRVVTDLGDLGTDELLERISRIFEVRPDTSPEPESRGRFSMYLGGRWWGLKAPAELVGADDPVERLDAAILQATILGPVLGIEDPRTSERIDFVGGVRGTKELERRATAAGEGVAFSLHPLGVDELMDVADAGRVLPPKSTWFEPKLRSGLLVHEFLPAEAHVPIDDESLAGAGERPPPHGGSRG